MLNSIMRIPRVLGQVALAMVIGHIALAYIFVWHRDLARTLQRGAKVVKEFMVTYIAPAQYDHIIEFLLDEKALLFMFFTVITRLLLDVLIETIGALWRRVRP